MFERVISQISDLKAENVKLLEEVEVLKWKVAGFESSTSPVQSHSVISDVIQELFERERCSNNLILYGVPESSSISIPEKISHDKMVIDKILVSLGDAVSSNLKLVRLDKACLDTTYSLKLIFENKEIVFHLF